MSHVCTQECPCRIDLDKAAIGLAEASKILSASLSSSPGSKWTVETHAASVKMAWLKLSHAVDAYREHFAEA